MTFDVAIVGGGPAGSSCAAFCALAGWRALILERETFPREKVCGDCLNPACWPVLDRLNLTAAVQAQPRAQLDRVELIAIDGSTVAIGLPSGERAEVSVKRSLFDQLLLARARELGVEVRCPATVTTLNRENSGHWTIEANGEKFGARFLVGADGRNSTVARLCHIAARPQRERIALQSHIPLPDGFGKRIVLQFLPEGYSGQAPVNDHELNLCLVARPDGIESLKEWAARQFAVPANHPWRTITPLTRAPLRPAHPGLLFIGDAARVVEPFTGEGIYYALRSGELAAQTLTKIFRGADPGGALSELEERHREMYRGRLWLNKLARTAVLAPRLASFFAPLARRHPSLLRSFISRIVGTPLRAR